MNSADWLSHRVCATQHFLTIWIKYIFLCIQVISVPQSILSNIETDVLKWFVLLRIRNKFLREIFFVLVFSQRAVDVASEWFAWSLALLFHCDFFCISTWFIDQVRAAVRLIFCFVFQQLVLMWVVIRKSTGAVAW